MSHNMQTLLSTAAELRSGGHSWESVASQVHRSVKTVSQWPNRFEVQWTLLFQKAQQKRQQEAASEALCCLRHLLNEEDLRIRVKAADSLLKLTPSPQGQAEMSEREMEVREALEKIEGAVDWFTPRVQAERQKQGLAPLSGKELEHACFHAFHQQLYEMHLSTGEYQALQHYRQQQKHESENTEPEDDSTHPIPSLHPLILLWLLLSTLLSGISAVREFQRNTMERTNPFSALRASDHKNDLAQQSGEPPPFYRPLSSREHAFSQVSVHPNDSSADPLFAETEIKGNVLNLIHQDDSLEDPHFPGNLEIAPLVLEIFDSAIEDNISPPSLTPFVGINDQNSSIIEEVGHPTRLAPFACGFFEDFVDFNSNEFAGFLFFWIPKNSNRLTTLLVLNELSISVSSFSWHPS